jgi:hypothetical protein
MSIKLVINAIGKRVNKSRESPQNVRKPDEWGGRGYWEGAADKRVNFIAGRFKKLTYNPNIVPKTRRALVVTTIIVTV